MGWKECTLLTLPSLSPPPFPPSQAFLQMQPPLSPALVLSILGDASPDLSALYLEAALHMGLALPQVRPLPLTSVHSTRWRSHECVNYALLVLPSPSAWFTL